MHLSDTRVCGSGAASLQVPPGVCPGPGFPKTGDHFPPPREPANPTSRVVPAACLFSAEPEVPRHRKHLEVP